MPAELTAPGLDVKIIREAIDSDQATRALRQILETTNWRRHEITMFGKTNAVPRLSAWYGDPGAIYTYSNITMAPESWPPVVLQLKSLVERLACYRFNSVLVNYYRHGSDSMGWHSDDEPELGAQPTIASLSLGATRRFKFKSRSDQSENQSIELAHGDVLIMSGQTQAKWQHQLPKTARPVGPRVNLTFRTILT